MTSISCHLLQSKYTRLRPTKLTFFFVAKLFTLLEQAVAFADPHSLFNGCYNSKVALIELVIVPRHIN